MRIAAVTGASRGIGRAIALALAQHGYHVFILARSERDLDSLAMEGEQMGLRLTPVLMDISSDDSRNEAVQRIMAATSGYGVDVLVNNAGYGQLGPTEEIPPEKLRRQLEVNVVGLLAFTQPFLPGMRERRAGTIVNISSIAGRIAAPFMGAYNASKFALEGLSDSLRNELAPFGVRIVLIEPGPIRTHFGEVADEFREEASTSPYSLLLHRWKAARRGSKLFERSPKTVARVVIRAIEARHPRPRYSITIQARLGVISRRFVPDVVVDWTFRRVMGKL